MEVIFCWSWSWKCFANTLPLVPNLSFKWKLRFFSNCFFCSHIKLFFQFPFFYSDNMFMMYWSYNLTLLFKQLFPDLKQIVTNQKEISCLTHLSHKGENIHWSYEPVCFGLYCISFSPQFSLRRSWNGFSDFCKCQWRPPPVKYFLFVFCIFWQLRNLLCQN